MLQLIDKIRETGKLINLSINASDIKQQSNNLNKFNLFFKKNIIIINNYKESIISLNKIDGKEFPYEDLSNCLYRVYKIKKDFKFNKPITESDCKLIISEIDGKSNELKKKWISYVESKTFQLVNSLKCFKDLVEESNDILVIINKIEILKRKWPVTEQVIMELDEAINLGHGVIEKLEVTDDVQDFIRMVSLGTATIDELTPKILEWIRKKKLTNRLIVSFKVKEE